MYLIKKLITIISVIILIYIIFLSSFKAKFSKDNSIYELKYNGLLWVALDYYTIIKYNSSDTTMKWITYKHAKNKQK